MVFKSGLIPSRTRASSSTSGSEPTAKVFGPTRARAKSGAAHKGKPLIVRFSNVLSFSIERMTCDTSGRASTRTNSRVAPASVVFIARVMRAASRGKFRTGVRCALPLSPAQTFCQSAA